MYRKIYQILEETGKVKTAMVLNGNHKGESARRQKLFIWEM